MNYCFITNTCQNLNLYNYLNIPYNTPFIGSYMQDDEAYVNFCVNYDYYILQVPVFKKSKQDKDTDAYTDYPVMFLGDFEIHWIHETNETDLLEKYNRRLERSRHTSPVFLWGDNLTLNNHTPRELEVLKKKFLNSPHHTIYLDKNDIPEWAHFTMTDRVPTTGHAKPLAWYTYDKACLASTLYFNRWLEESTRLLPNQSQVQHPQLNTS